MTGPGAREPQPSEPEYRPRWADARDEHDVYVRVLNVMRVELRSEEVAENVILDWQRQADGTERLVGVEVLGVRGVEMDGLDVVKGRPHGTGPGWRPAGEDAS